MADSANHLLLIDTCGAAGSLAVAVIRPEASVLGRAGLPGRSTSERLLPEIRELLHEQGIGLGQLAGIAIAHGPGSFTGVRVGLSAAKGLCEALTIPLIAVSRLAVLAGMSASSEVLALLDAGRGEFYCGHYAEGRCLRQTLGTREQVRSLAQHASAPRLIGCEDLVTEAFPAETVDRVPEPTAADILPHAVRRFECGEFDDIAGIDANYVRRTDVEIFAKQVRQPAGRV